MKYIILFQREYLEGSKLFHTLHCQAQREIIQLYNMEKIKIKVNWCDKNYAAVSDDERLHGVVVATAGSYDELLVEVRRAIAEHAGDMEEVAPWVKAGEYGLDVEMGAAALIRLAENYTSLKIISRVSGINQALLTHYATGLKVPRDGQRARIVDALHAIGEALAGMR